ncbi:hypothetical protein SK128_017067, partial [Halocaridina rubra]
EEPHQAVYKFTSFRLQNKNKVQGKKKCTDVLILEAPYQKQIKLCGKRSGMIRVPNFRFQNRFITDKRKTNKGFNITIQAVKTNCHQFIDLRTDNKTKGVISTPRFPDDYPKNTQCEWWIKAPAGQQLQLTINKLNIRRTKGCKDAYIIVNRNGDRSYPRDNSRLMCGRAKNKVIRSVDDEINIVFDGGVRRAMGVKATYEVL